MAILNIFKVFETPITTTVAHPEGHRTQLEQIVREHAALRETVAQAQVAFETHDRFLRDRYLNPAQPAVLGIEDDVGEQRRRSLRYALGEAQLALVEFEKKHDLPAVEAELADILANGDARERVAARRELIRRMIEFETDILRAGAARWTEIAQLGDEIERRWPGQRLTMDLPHIPQGTFTTGGGLRSIPTWFHETLCAAEPGLFEEDDPVRQRIEAMKRERRVVIWHPLPPEWI